MNHIVGKWKSQDGVTMLELIAVLIIIGVLAAVAISRMTDPKEYDLLAQAEVVKAHLRLAQNKAMNANTVCGINFSSGSYTMFNNGNTANVIRFLGQNNADNVTIPGGITITTGIVSFDAWGKPYTDAAGTTAQTDNPRSLTLTKGSSTKTITIKPNTGYIP